MGKDVQVGVYPGTGDLGIMEALSAADGIEAHKLEWCSPDALSALDCVVIPHGKQVAPLDGIRPWRAVLRRYVELGGGIVLTHNAVGYRGVFAQNELFPEIETAAGRKDAWTFETNPDSKHPLARKLPKTIRHAYSDHITMQPGPRGEVICIDDDGDATVVAGTFGKGRVVAMGALAGWRAVRQQLKHYDGEAAIPEGAERALLVESVRWAGDGTPFNEARMKRELNQVAEKPAGKPLVVFSSSFSSYRLSPNEWTVARDPNMKSRGAWCGIANAPEGGGRIAQTYLVNQPLVAKPFKKGKVSGAFDLEFEAIKMHRYGGVLDVALTNSEGWGYGVRLVYLNESDPDDAPHATIDQSRPSPPQDRDRQGRQRHLPHREGRDYHAGRGQGQGCAPAYAGGREEGAADRRLRAIRADRRRMDDAARGRQGDCGCARYHVRRVQQPVAYNEIRLGVSGDRQP